MVDSSWFATGKSGQKPSHLRLIGAWNCANIFGTSSSYSTDREPHVTAACKCRQA